MEEEAGLISRGLGAGYNISVFVPGQSGGMVQITKLKHRYRKLNCDSRCQHTGRIVKREWDKVAQVSL